MTAYYNENDPFAAAWLRNLISDNLIAQGEVDERSIVDVQPSDLSGFTQCHFFAGIGVWSYALRLAGWPDNRPVWTGSCPCQPFSSAGQRQGGSDSRHLWPHWSRLIAECRPVAIFGEQVESAVAHGWFDLVSDDLEAHDYAVGAVSFPAAGVGAPHIRQRIYWMAQSECERLSPKQIERESRPSEANHVGARSESIGVVNSSIQRRQQVSRSASGHEETHGWEQDGDYVAAGDGEAGWLAQSNGRNSGSEWLQRSWEQRQQQEDGGAGELVHSSQLSGENGPSTREGLGRPASSSYDGTSELGFSNSRRLSPRHETSPSNRYGYPSQPTSFWSECSWLPCIDGKARPVESGTFPLAHGVANRVGTLRGYGNALVAPQAQAFIAAYMEI